jgi:hypothetical protein
MKNARRSRKPAPDELRPEYNFDYSKAKPNPYACQLKGRTVAVLLEPDVAKVFRTSESVNTVLRTVMTAIPRRSAAPRKPTARSSRRAR